MTPYAPPAGSGAAAQNTGSAVPGLGDWFKDFYLNYGPTQAGFWQFLNDEGLDRNTQPGKWAQGQEGKYYSRYLADQARDPNLGFYDYLKSGRAGNPNEDYQNQSPQQRGDFSSQFLTPRVRWSFR